MMLNYNTIIEFTTRSRWRLRHLRSKLTYCTGEYQNHKTIWLKGISNGRFLQKVTTLTSLVTIDENCDKRDLIISICHFTSHNRLFNWSCDFIVVTPHTGVVAVEIERSWFATWYQKTTCLKGCVTSLVETPHSKLPPRHF